LPWWQMTHSLNIATLNPDIAQQRRFPAAGRER